MMSHLETALPLNALNYRLTNCCQQLDGANLVSIGQLIATKSAIEY